MSVSDLSVSLIIGLLALDTTIAFQVLLAQPLFACSILGALLGNLPVGIEIGILMQLLWLNVVPLGASTFPEGNVGSMLACVIIIRWGSAGFPNSTFLVALILALASSYIGARLTVLDRHLNSRFLDAVMRAAHRIQLRKIIALHILSIAVYFLIMSGLAWLVLTAAGGLMSNISTELLQKVEPQLFLIKPATWGIGIGLTIPLIIQALRQRN